MHHNAIPWLCALLLLLAGGHASHAQDVSRYKVLSDSVYRSSTVYLNGNKYQKDATVFMDIVAFTHPYFVTPERRAEWQSHGHQDELYRVPAQKRPKGFRQPKLFKGRVVFVMGKRTYSSAGILLTLARDNHIGTIIGTTSTFSPSHYGEILPYRLPNTGVLGNISCKYFVRPDAATADAPCLEPDIAIDLDDKDATWRFICENFSSQL